MHFYSMQVKALHEYRTLECAQSIGLLWLLDLPSDMNKSCAEHYSLKAILAASITLKQTTCLADRTENTSGWHKIPTLKMKQCLAPECRGVNGQFWWHCFCPQTAGLWRGCFAVCNNSCFAGSVRDLTCQNPPYGMVSFFETVIKMYLFFLPLNVYALTEWPFMTQDELSTSILFRYYLSVLRCRLVL